MLQMLVCMHKLADFPASSQVVSMLQMTKSLLALNFRVECIQTCYVCADDLDVVTWQAEKKMLQPLIDKARTSKGPSDGRQQ